MDRRQFSISIVARNALWDKYNKNRMRMVGQWERKVGWNLSKHESHEIKSFNSNNITLFKIKQCYASFKGSLKGFKFLDLEQVMFLIHLEENNACHK